MSDPVPGRPDSELDPVPGAAGGSGAAPVCGPGPDGEPAVECVITVIDGAEGRRLGVLQATAIRAVLTWLAVRHRDEQASKAAGTSDS